MTAGHEGHGLASISLTHVYFNPSDKVSYAFAYITLAPIAIMVFYASVIVSRREMAGILMLAGQLLNEVLNYILKEHLQQDRPYGNVYLYGEYEIKAHLHPSWIGHLGDGYGMPSSHSQFIWYFAVYGSLYLFNYIHLDHTVWKVLTSAAMFALAILVAVSR